MTAAGQDDTPESASLHVKLTTTSAAYQPAAFGARSDEACTDGAVLSIDTATGSLAVFPALSRATPVTG